MQGERLFLETAGGFQIAARVELTDVAGVDGLASGLLVVEIALHDVVATTSPDSPAGTGWLSVSTQRSSMPGMALPEIGAMVSASAHSETMPQVSTRP